MILPGRMCLKVLLLLLTLATVRNPIPSSADTGMQQDTLAGVDSIYPVADVALPRSMQYVLKAETLVELMTRELEEAKVKVSSEMEHRVRPKAELRLSISGREATDDRMYSYMVRLDLYQIVTLRGRTVEAITWTDSFLGNAHRSETLVLKEVTATMLGKFVAELRAENLPRR